MPHVVEQLAELTAYRDRDVADTTLVAALRDLLQAREVAIHRCVGEDNDRRWLTRARLGLDDVAASADPLYTDLNDLPALDRFPARLQALQQQTPVALALAAPGEPHLTVFPLTTDREVVGVLELLTSAPLDTAAHRLVGSILRLYRNFQALLDYSERDTLTGLLNRKTFDEAFYKLSILPGTDLGASEADSPAMADRRVAPAQQPHYIGVIDIDHFKSVNDNFGHLIGDEVLLLVAQLMRSNFRHGDRIYRFGGEEFVVLLRCPDADAARIAYERLRYRIESHDFPQIGSLTVSIGFTGIDADDTPGAAFERADQAVYQAKQTGRNRTVADFELAPSATPVEAAPRGELEFF